MPSPLAQKLEQDNLRLVCQRSVEELHQLFVAWFQGSEPRESLTSSLMECLAPDFSHVAPNGQFLQGRNILIGHLQDKFGCYKNRLFQIEIYDVRLLWHDASGSKCLCTYEEWQSWLPDNAQQITNSSQQDDETSDHSNHNRNNGEGPESSSQGGEEEEDEEVHQFGRLSTCLLERKTNDPNNSDNEDEGMRTSTSSYRWIHVHETWLEAESPQHEKYQQQHLHLQQQQQEQGVELGDVAVNGSRRPGGIVVGARGAGGSDYLEEDTILTGPMEYHRMIADRSPPSMLETTTTSSEGAGAVEASQQPAPQQQQQLLQNATDNNDDESSTDDMGVVPPPGGLPPPVTASDKDDDGENGKTKPTRIGAAALVSESGDSNNEDEDDFDDDDDDDMEEGDRHLLMLMSTQSLSRDQMARQNGARDALESSGIAFYELDGANPNERENRNSLFQLSGKWGQYPQFFLVDTAGTTTFWGTWEDFLRSHSQGRLAQDIAAATSSSSSNLGGVSSDALDGVHEDKEETVAAATAESTAPPRTPASRTVSEDAAVEEAATRAKSPAAAATTSSAVTPENKAQSRQLAADGAAAATTAVVVSNLVDQSPTSESPQNLPPPVPDNSQLLVLISTQTLSNEQNKRQEEVARILKEHNVQFETIDGSSKTNRERRNQLFRISTFWGKYPQFFHEEKPPPESASSSSNGSGDAGSRSKSHTTTFWGRWEEFELSHQRNTLVEDLKYIRPTSLSETPKSSSLTISNNSSPRSFGSPASSKEETAAVAAAAALQLVPSSPEQDELTNSIILLVSNQSLSRDQMARQEQVRGYLKEAGISYQELDGSSRDHRQRRNELFKISKLWGRYPQLFVVQTIRDATTGGQQPMVVFWGDWEKIESSHSNGSFGEGIKALLAGPSTEEPVEDETTSRALTTVDATSSELKSGSQMLFRSAEDEFLEKAEGILQFEEDENQQQQGEVDANSKALVLANEKLKEEKKQEEESMNEEKFKVIAAAVSPIPQDVSSKRHVSSKLLKHAKPLTWENSLVGLSLHGFDIGTSQGPIADETWYREVTEALETISQYKRASSPRRKLNLPEMVFPTAHVALEGHGFWLSWDVLDAMEDWARAHSEIPVNSRESHKGVSVLKSKDAKLWEKKQAAIKNESSTNSSVFHYDWTYSTPFAGKMEGGEWVELDESGMRLELLTDTSIPILFFDEITLFEDDLHDNGQVLFTVKIRVMPSCAYVLARLWLRVDHVVVRVRETRLLVDFFGMGPAVYRDITWRECYWDSFKVHKLPMDLRSWHFDGKETPAWQNLLRKIPEVDPPEGVMRFATLEPSNPSRHIVKQLNSSVAEALTAENSLEYLEA
ncbi:hypothetical protein ACA910_015999 [Epithemia clementina (nom. ined.)]